MSEPRSASILDVLHAFAMFAAAGLVAAYWLAFFGADITKANLASSQISMPEYLTFQNAFPLPDAAMAVCFAISSVLLIGQDRLALLWGILASGMMLFLALIDINFNVINGLYSLEGLRTDKAMQIEAAINAGALIFAIWTAARMWNHPLRRGDENL